MSYEDYEKFKQNVHKCQYYRSIGGKNEQEISAAEEMLGLKFSRQCRAFFAEYGYVSFYGNEIFGFSLEHLDIYVANAVAMALQLRKEDGLPHEWLPIYDFADGYMVFQDYSRLNDEGEPIIIVGGYNGERFVQVEIAAEDFGEFVLRLVMMQLESQE